MCPEPLCPLSTSHRSSPERLSLLISQGLGDCCPPARQMTVSVWGSVSPVTRPSGTLELPTPLIAAHQLYNYVADHASSYHMKPLRMARPGGPEHNEYALVSAWHR